MVSVNIEENVKIKKLRFLLNLKIEIWLSIVFKILTL